MFLTYHNGELICDIWSNASCNIYTAFKTTKSNIAVFVRRALIAELNCNINDKIPKNVNTDSIWPPLRKYRNADDNLSIRIWHLWISRLIWISVEITFKKIEKIILVVAYLKWAIGSNKRDCSGMKHNQDCDCKGEFETGHCYCWVVALTKGYMNILSQTL